ncbi:type I-MYXAN CRISPR-associated protein Cas6/Cmx6, partial [Thermosynechococcus sp.]|uniref:type I-MYXAN CRISPR-associated protein Cas6/Cmx6 n=1 Tax=Thermosynechococcus sp. TaxID=2814275 RepID=UPI00391C281E
INGEVVIPKALKPEFVWVKQKKILGYQVLVKGLTPEESLRLQCYGLGGRQHFGCGWFYPATLALAGNLSRVL